MDNYEDPLIAIFTITTITLKNIMLTRNCLKHVDN